MKMRYTFIIVFLLMMCNCFAQLNITTTSNAQLLAQTLVGPGISVSNATLNAGQGMAGSFTGVSNLGLNPGILLTTGLAVDAEGPNNNLNLSYVWDFYGDADLANTLGQAQSTLFDGCTLEFDFVAPADSIAFTYVFGSEEYPVFACSAFDDVMAIYMQGPGISGLKNIGAIPGTNIPVSINTINAGPGPLEYTGGHTCPPIVYGQYLINNGTYDTSNTEFLTQPNDSLPYYIQYNGFTTPLNACIGGLTPCAVYHLKVTIADVGDGQYDSGLFLQGGITWPQPVTNVVFGTPYTNDSLSDIATAGCSTGIIPIQLLHPATTDTTVYFAIGGTAVNGIDYATIADSVVFNIGDSMKNILVSPIMGAFTGTKNITLTVNGICNGLISATLSISSAVVLIISPRDTTICSGKSVPLISSGNGWTYRWTPVIGLSDPYSANPTARPLLTTTYICRSYLNGCSVSDSVQIIVVPVPHTLVFDAPYTSDSILSIATAGCNYGIIPVKLIPPAQSDTSVKFSIAGTGINGTDYTLLADSVTFLAGDSLANILIQPIASSRTGNRTVILQYFPECDLSYSDTIVIANSFRLSVYPVDTEICRGDTIYLSANSTGNINWNQSSYLSDTSIANPLATPSVTTAFICTSTLGNCVLTDTGFVTVDACPLSISDLNDVNGFEIFPNPAGDYAMVQIKSGYIKQFDLILADVTGRIIQQFNKVAVGQFQFNLTQLPAGVYIVTLKSTEGTQSKQLVKF